MSFKYVKDVIMTDSLGQGVGVTGVLSEDGHFVVGCTMRRSKENWKDNTSGGQTTLRAIGDIQIFAASNVVETEEGVVTADVTPAYNALSVFAMQSKDIDPITHQPVMLDPFIRGPLDGEYHSGKNSKNPKKFSDIVPKSIHTAIDEAINVGAESIVNRKRTTNARIARAVNALANLAYTKTATSSSATPMQEQTGATSGMSAESVLPL